MIFMAQDEFRDVNLTVQIGNFRRRRRCPYCGETPKEMEWSSEGLRIWCRNPECTGGHYRIFYPIMPQEIDLIQATKRALKDWGKYCSGISQQRRSARRAKASG